MNEVWVVTVSDKYNPNLVQIVGIFSQFHLATSKADATLREITYGGENWKNTVRSNILIEYQSDEGDRVSIRRYILDTPPHSNAFEAASSSNMSQTYYGPVAVQSMTPPRVQLPQSSLFPSGIQTPNFPQSSSSSGMQFPSFPQSSLFPSGIQTPNFPQSSSSSGMQFPSGIQTPSFPQSSSSSGMQFPRLNF